MPLAIQYGMPLNEFWHGDMRLFEAYAKAYTADVSFRAWTIGNYTQIAHEIALSNAFAKKGAKRAEYPKWQNPTEKIQSKKKLTKNNLEKTFRNQQLAESMWFNDFLNKK